MAHQVYSVPGVYREPRPRQPAFPRARTDVAGFVGVAGPRRLGELCRIDDWRGYVETFLRDDRGDAISPPAGATLADTVRAYFANGGARCWVVNAAAAIEASRADELLNDMLGLTGGGPSAGPDGRRGLERLLSVPEVAIVALPELDASVAEDVARTEELPPSFEDSFFRDCCQLAGTQGTHAPPPDRRVVGRLYPDPATVRWAQRYLIERCQREPWRAFVILAPPPGLGPTEVIRWRESLSRDRALDTGDCAALYWPWLKVQDSPGRPVEIRSPVGHVAGVFARRDQVRGPHVAPANEPLHGVVGLELPVTDRINGPVYDSGVNVLRALPGRGIHVWGARTLRWHAPPSAGTAPDPLVYVSARRCLSAIERSAERIGQPAVFEPNSALLRAQVTQAITGYMMQVFESGVLAGETPEQAFFVRCDSTLNPPESVAEGRLICEIGAALAAPAEFIVFRVGRQGGVIEISEPSAAGGF